MRILIDTNIVLSAILSPQGSVAETLKLAIQAGFTICLCTFTIGELRAVVLRKFPSKKASMELFLAEFSYELLLTPALLPPGLPPMRDPNDLPILASALVGDVDMFLTGDRDFETVILDRPIILTPAKFMQMYSDISIAD